MWLGALSNINCNEEQFAHWCKSPFQIDYPLFARYLFRIAEWPTQSITFRVHADEYTIQQLVGRSFKRNAYVTLASPPSGP